MISLVKNLTEWFFYDLFGNPLIAVFVLSIVFLAAFVLIGLDFLISFTSIMPFIMVATGFLAVGITFKTIAVLIEAIIFGLLLIGLVNK